MQRPQSGAAALALILAIGAAVFLPALGQETSLVSREARHAEIAREMLVTGEYAVPYVCGIPYIDKPPLFNWIVAGLFRVTGRVDFAVARFPSVVAAIAAAIAIYLLGARWASPRAGVLASIVWLTSWLVVEWGRASRMDMMMASALACGVLLADVAATSEASVRRWAAWCAACLLVGTAVLSKGPVLLLFFLGSVVALWRARTGRWAPSAWQLLVGAALLALPFVAWAIPVEHAHPGHLQRLFGYQLGEGLVEHEKRITLYIDQIILRTLPWSAFAAGAWLWSWRRLRKDGYATAVIPAVISAAALVVMTFVPNKRPHYLLPMLPLWALLIGGFLDAAWTGESATGGRRLPKWAFELPLGVCSAGITLASAGALVYWLGWGANRTVWGAVMLAVVVALGLAATAAAWRERFGRSLVMLAAASTVLAISMYPVIIPGLTRNSAAEVAARELAASIPAGVRLADYRVVDEYMCFKLDQKIEFPRDEASLAAWVAGGPGCVIAPAGDEAVVREACGGAVERVSAWDVKGFNVVVLAVNPAGVAGDGIIDRGVTRDGDTVR